MVVYARGYARIYLQETTSSQLDSISNSTDTTQASLVQTIELTYEKKESEYLTCDGETKYFTDAIRVEGSIKQLFGFGEILAAVVGQDVLSTGTYTVSKPTFPPKFTIHLVSDPSASQQFDIRLTNVEFKRWRLSQDDKGQFLSDVTFVGTLGTTTYKGGP